MSKEEKFNSIEVAEITGINVDKVRQGFRDFLEVKRLPRNKSFNQTEIQIVVQRITSAHIYFNNNLIAAATIMNSQEKSKKLFDSAYGIKNLKFPPSLRVYERLLKPADIQRIKESWKRKHEYLYNNTDPIIE